MTSIGTNLGFRAMMLLLNATLYIKHLTSEKCRTLFYAKY